MKFNVKPMFRLSLTKRNRLNQWSHDAYDFPARRNEKVVGVIMDLKLTKSYLTVFMLLCGFIFSAAAYAQGEQATLLQETNANLSRVNLKHFNHLFTPIEVDNKKMAVVYIYSKYPNYTYASEPAEGFGCVDDAARAIVMLAGYLKVQHDDELLYKIKMLVEFVLHMQNDNGYFNNFIWQGLSINTSYKTSVAEMNWWSLRALWSLELAYELFRSDIDLVNRIKKAIDNVVARIKRDIPITRFETEIVNTIKVPTWLPGKYASDQSAVAIIALLSYYKRSEDIQILKIIHALAKGIMQMQKGDAKNYPYGMFLSWKNEWHAWGNSQAYALLLAGQQLGHPEYTQSALLEVDYFYPYLVKNGFISTILIKRVKDRYSRSSEKHFPQITYGLRPMVFAVSEAYRITKNKKYSAQLTKIKSWLSGNNVAGKLMYDQRSGRTYDAINSATEINMNSGAESTIEGLLVMQR